MKAAGKSTAKSKLKTSYITNLCPGVNASLRKLISSLFKTNRYSSHGHTCINSTTTGETFDCRVLGKSLHVMARLLLWVAPHDL